jgi:hypothetical protein
MITMGRTVLGLLIRPSTATIETFGPAVGEVDLKATFAL